MDGVRRLGPSWNAILWSYPFQNGRTNVDLAKKYRRLQARFPSVSLSVFCCRFNTRKG